MGEKASSRRDPARPEPEDFTDSRACRAPQLKKMSFATQKPGSVLALCPQREKVSNSRRGQPPAGAMSSLSELEQHGSEAPSEGVGGSAPATEEAVSPTESDETGQRAVLSGGDTATDLTQPKTPPEPELPIESPVAAAADTTTELRPPYAEPEAFENFTVDRVIAPPSLVLLPSFAPVVTREAEPEPALPDYVLLHSEPTHPQPAPFTLGENSFDSGSTSIVGCRRLNELNTRFFSNFTSFDNFFISENTNF